MGRRLGWGRRLKPRLQTPHGATKAASAAWGATARAGGLRGREACEARLQPPARRSPNRYAGWWLRALLFLAVVVPAGMMAAVGRFDGLYGQDPFAYNA